jgi:hypothetical protein
MNKIWANRLIAGTQVWANVPASRKNAVMAILLDYVQEGKITQERYNDILGINEE